MRTVHRNAPIIIAAGALVLLLVAPASLSLFTAEPAYTGSVVIDAESTEGVRQPAAFAELRAKLDGTDRAVALNALQVALTELGDGATLIWKRPSRDLTGVIKPVSAFRDDEGRVCRHLTYSLSLGTFVREVVGIACREPSSSWSLAG
jgi:surface antigen